MYVRSSSRTKISLSTFTKIAILQHHIQGYVGRLSLLQSRLLATLDTLDVIQTHHAQELGNAIRNQTILREKLDEYIKVVRAAELERDDMRDAVLKLVEKGVLRFQAGRMGFAWLYHYSFALLHAFVVVETSNDYRTWPHSQIRLSSLAGWFHYVHFANAYLPGPFL
jgi:hypothetical protein